MLLGSLVNFLAIVAGSLSGIVLRNITEQTKETVTKGIALGTIALAIKMSMQTASFTIIIISICLGGMIGEFLKIEDSMTNLGLLLEKRFARGNGNFAEGFVTATLIYVIGSMGIIGAIESGISGNHQTLFTKAVMDGFMSIMLTASLGIGVLFSAFPVLIYQGIITIFASFIVRYLPPELLDSIMSEISAIGGLMILAIGLNVMKLTKIRVSNYLPGIIVLIIIMIVQYYYF
ncbi:DUF554 domain-containing protein [Enterococcus pseudoavium]|uniref:DUF554 domain-containing protein n=1 Tax=Enterococcus pseudoavium TaxID=44007 RepID=A0AAE4HZI1_9ENTE|nr:DUF554 domain-containing protein [Enterococcus pseudoavium]MDT2736341.1 DUF554 domain-containing protein [Enterococcus pseudoavium]MDT2753488.1 DUF554 domain-containing protein [Enterococcus pseudoavium]MDT2770707.1 DUF554 domain-containing protein [Enterococcus pseudoavium]REC32356.1 hypothetical protein CF160_07785 [Enterococcus pseudoavium]